MGDLVLAADAAYPFDLRLLPLKCDIVLGYAGQSHATPHVWTFAEVEQVRASGRKWWPIWTPPQQSMDPTSGVLAAQGLDVACDVLKVAKSAPKFLDIEAGTWQRDPGRANGFISAWRLEMNRRGHRFAFAYVPLAAGFGWVAHWTMTRPTSLPKGWVGQQYANALAADAYDLSVFDLAALGQQTDPADKSTNVKGQTQMVIVRDDTDGKEYLQGDDKSLTWLQSPATVQGYLAAGVPLVEGAATGDLAKFPGYQGK